MGYYDDLFISCRSHFVEQFRIDIHVSDVLDDGSSQDLRSIGILVTLSREKEPMDAIYRNFLDRSELSPQKS
jgi:hypothetical protein